MGDMTFDGIEVMESENKKGLILKYSYLKAIETKSDRFHEEEWIVSPEYDNIIVSSPYYIFVKKDNFQIGYFIGTENFTGIENVKLKYLHEGQGREVNISKVFDYHFSKLYSNSICGFTSDSKYGLVDFTGIVMKPIYDGVAFISQESLVSEESIIIAKKNKRYMVYTYNTSRKVEKLGLFSRNYSSVKKKVLKKTGINLKEDIRESDIIGKL